MPIYTGRGDGGPSQASGIWFDDLVVDTDVTDKSRTTVPAPIEA